MLLLIIEIIMLVTGIWAIITGTVPSFLLGGGGSRIEGWGARIIGLVLVSPIPIAFIGGLVLSLLIGLQATTYAILLELAIVIGAALAAILLSRTIGKPVAMTHNEMTENVIATKARGSLIYVILGGFGIAAIILLPLAFIRSTQALRLIDEQKIGEQHRNTAKLARVLSIMLLVFWLAICLILVFFVFANR